MTIYSTLFVDLDQTVYPASTGIWEDVATRIHSFLQEALDLDPQEAVERRIYYYEKYGTSLRGLQQEAKVDPIKYMEYIHDVPVEAKIQPDPALPALLRAISVPKYIFTNASIDHAQRVLNHLGVQNCFDGIIDIISLGFYNKPDPLAYQRALELTGDPEGQTCILLDDSLMNLEAASLLGMTTVHVGPHRDADFTPDFQISSIHDLPAVIPEIHQDHQAEGDQDG